MEIIDPRKKEVSKSNSSNNLRDEAISKLWEDKASQSVLLKSLYKEMMDSPNLLSLPASNQFLVLFSQADFAKSDDERVYVANIFYRRLFDKDILPLVTEHTGIQLAERCLVSSSLFEKHMHERSRRYSAPKPAFYRKVGISKFEENRRFDVAMHFDAWTEYAGYLFSAA